MEAQGRKGGWRGSRRCYRAGNVCAPFLGAWPGTLHCQWPRTFQATGLSKALAPKNVVIAHAAQPSSSSLARKHFARASGLA